MPKKTQVKSGKARPKKASRPTILPARTYDDYLDIATILIDEAAQSQGWRGDDQKSTPQTAYRAVRVVVGQAVILISTILMLRRSTQKVPLAFPPHKVEFESSRYKRAQCYVHYFDILSWLCLERSVTFLSNLPAGSLKMWNGLPQTVFNSGGPNAYNAVFFAAQDLCEACHLAWTETGGFSDIILEPDYDPENLSRVVPWNKLNPRIMRWRLNIGKRLREEFPLSEWPEGRVKRERELLMARAFSESEQAIQRVDEAEAAEKAPPLDTVSVLARFTSDQRDMIPKVAKVLGKTEAKMGVQIAGEMKRAYAGSVKTLLAKMKREGILTGQKDEGYRLTPQWHHLAI